MEQYPKDEFDELAQERNLRGSHRKKRSWGRRLLPFFAVLILSPALGWGVVELMSQDGMTNPFEAGTTTTHVTTHTATESAKETEDPTADETDEPSVTDEPTETVTTEEPTDEPEPSIETLPPVPGVTYDASINLLNGTGVPAGTDPTESMLLVAGYTAITGEEFFGNTPAYSAIYFSSPEFYSTAQHLAQTLNIDFWAENPALTGGYDVTIIIR